MVYHLVRSCYILYSTYPAAIVAILISSRFIMNPCNRSRTLERISSSKNSPICSGGHSTRTDNVSSVIPASPSDVRSWGIGGCRLQRNRCTDTSWESCSGYISPNAKVNQRTDEGTARSSGVEFGPPWTFLDRPFGCFRGRTLAGLGGVTVGTVVWETPVSRSARHKWPLCSPCAHNSLRYLY
jgi:hypothetical protein